MASPRLAWAEYIGTLGYVRMRLAEVGPEGVYELTVPHLAATARDDIQPIAVKPHGNDIFAIWRAGEPHNGGLPVLWYPLDGAEPMADFFELFSFTYVSYRDDLEEIEPLDQEGSAG